VYPATTTLPLASSATALAPDQSDAKWVTTEPVPLKEESSAPSTGVGDVGAKLAVTVRFAVTFVRTSRELALTTLPLSSVQLTKRYPSRGNAATSVVLPPCFTAWLRVPLMWPPAPAMKVTV